jgi:hypothetical protein
VAQEQIHCPVTMQISITMLTSSHPRTLVSIENSAALGSCSSSGTSTSSSVDASATPMIVQPAGRWSDAAHTLLLQVFAYSGG